MTEKKPPDLLTQLFPPFFFLSDNQISENDYYVINLVNPSLLPYWSWKTALPALFATMEHKNSSYDGQELHEISQSPHIKALKFWKG